MPMYDIRCSQCGFEGTARISLQELSTWDLDSQCSQCHGDPSCFQRIIKMAPASVGGATPAQARAADLVSSKQKFARSGEKDSMSHRAFQKRDPDRVAAAVEAVRKGEFEGF